MLLFLVKHSRPDIANITKELSNANSGADPAVFCELLCVMRYILNTKNFGLKLEPTKDGTKHWEIVCFSDSICTGDNVSRRSLIFYVLSTMVS